MIGAGQQQADRNERPPIEDRHEDHRLQPNSRHIRRTSDKIDISLAILSRLKSLLGKSTFIEVDNHEYEDTWYWDGSRATVLVSDVGLGGLNTRVTAFMTDGVIKANMTANDAIEAYAIDPATFNDEYFTEKLETKAGWNRPSCDEDWFRGFAQEIEDFVYAIRDKREPRAGIDLAVDCVNLIYSAYLSAEEGRPVNLE